MPLVSTRIKNFGEFMELCNFFFINHMPYSFELLTPKGHTPEHAALLLQAMIWALDAQEDWSKLGFEKASHEVATAFGVNHKKSLFPFCLGY